MKNFTNNFKQFTSRLSARWLIMALMLLLGTSSAWAAGFWGEKAWNIKFYSPSQGKDIWINDNYDAGHSSGSTIDLGTFSSAPYLKGYWAKTWGYGNNTDKFVKITFNNSTTNDGVSKQWDSNGDQMWKSESLNIKFPDTEGSHEESITFAINGAETMTCKIKYNICASCCTNYYLQHPWNGGNWTWKELKKEDCNNNIYTLTANYGNAGCDYSKPGVQEKQDYIANPILEGNPVKGDECIFTFDANNKTITITKVVTCNDNPDFSVSLSKSEVAVGCTGVTASITGNDSPTVTWSSSDDKVATINSSTGAITIIAAGTTTITATTTEDGGFCGGVEKKATLTVKSPSVTVKANDNSLCEGETLTLTATLTNCGTGNSIQWYKGEDLLTGETKDQLTISSVTTTNSGEYKAVVTGGIICSSIESSAVTITVNARPSAPSLSNPEPICYGTPFTLPEKDNSKKTITWNVNNRELTNLSVGPHTYTAKIVENGCESTTVDYTITVKEQLAKPDLAVTNVKQCGSNYTEGKIVINHYNPANTYILKKDGTPITKDYNEGYAISETETGEYTVEVSKDGACGATSDDVTIEVINNTPTVNPFEITLQNNACEGNPLKLSYNDTEQSGTVSYAWYEGTNREVLGTEKTFTIQQAKNATYKLVVTVTSNSCPANGEAEITVAPKAVPVAPTFDQDEMSACVGERFELPMPNNLIGEEEALWTVEGLPTTASQTIDEVGDYKYIAYKNDGCPSQGTPFTVHVNPLPTINIGEDVTAVKFEDVELTATGENIHNVEWTADKGTITKDATDPKRAILTYNQTGDVTVTAKAISAAGCESAEVSKKVRFGEEDCNNKTEPTEDVNTIEIWCRMSDNSDGSSIKCYGFGAGDFFGSYPGSKANNGTGTYKSKTYQKWIYTFDSKKSGLKVIFNTNGDNDKTGDISVGSSGKRYYYWYNKSSKTYGLDDSETIYTTTTIPPAITTPAVKMLSAYSEEGSGELSMTAQIVKTGCNGNMTYYFKYRLKGAQEWSQTAAQTATGLKAGDEINATVSNLDQGGTYEIQAVINNTNEAVSNILEYVVNIQETAIYDVALQFADSKGDVLQNQDQIYCVASTAYIKLSYRGTAHKSLEWIAENELQPVNGIDKLYSYVVRGNETITANVANDANEGTPATGTIDIKVYTIATTPDISIDRTEVCSADQVGAKITVNAPQIGITYQAYKMVGDVETPHGDAVVADNAESIIINSIKETGTYYVKAWNAQCRDAIAVSLLKFAVTKIDASSNTIAITPETASTNPWMPVTVKVDKNSAYDYILVCKHGETDVTDQMVINKKGDSYVIKFPKPESAVINGNGQVVFDDITYSVTVSLNGNVECGVTSATSTVTLTNLIEDCD